MKRNQEQLKFVVEFAQKKLNEMRPGDLLNFRDDFVMFFYRRPGEDIRGPIGEITIPFEKPLPQDYTLDDFGALQQDVCSILNEIVTRRDTEAHSAPVCDIKAKLWAMPFGLKDQFILQATGSTRDMFLLRLFLLLTREPSDRILRCKATDCDKIFYRERKQVYCSTRCTNRNYMKSYRKPQREDRNLKEIASEDNHRRYEKRVKRKNPDKEVVRRPRN